MSHKSCLRCDRYLSCKDSRKSIIYSCDRFKVTAQSLSNEKARFEDILGEPFVVSTAEVPTETDENMFDAQKALKRVLNDKRMVSPDIKIPEGDFPEAPNFYRWCVDDRFLNQKPFVMQAYIGTKLFAEYCPRCSDVDWMDNGIKATSPLTKFESKVALLEHGICPYCGATKLTLFKSKELLPYNELALAAGQRGGKSAVTGMMSSYLTHRAIKLERPNEVYGLLKANVLQGTFVALTFAQAKDTLWEPFYGHLIDSPWFVEYNSMLDHYQERTGEELYKLKDTFVYYRHRRIQVYPAGPDKRILRGRTRLFAGIDELGWFQSGVEAAKNIKMNANEVYIALERSLLTLRSKAVSLVRQGFYNIPFGYFLNISSPSSARDKIMELVRQSQGSTKLYGLVLPTWKMNPHVPRSALAEEFRKDPEAAMRDYGAQPPLTNNPFISSQDKIELCLSKKKHRLEVQYKQVKSKDGNSAELYGSITYISESTKPSVLALDAGYSNNAFAFAVGHRSKNGYPVISCVGEIIPMPGMKINHSLMYSNLLSEVVAMRNIVLAAADRWNSLKVLADLEQEFGMEKVQYSLKYVDMQLFKSYIFDKQILLPRASRPISEILKYNHSEYPMCFKNKPDEHLILQLLTVQDTGSSVIKGEGLTDDILRASMLCFKMLTDSTYDDILNGAGEDIEQRQDLASMVVSKLYSGGGTGGSGGLGGSGNGSSLGVLKQRN
jgi:hypothetical protein